MNKDHIRPHEMIELLGISLRTLQRWDNEGYFKARRTPTNRRCYTYDQYLAYTGQSLPEKEDNKKTVIYARVSSSSQKDDLNNQAELQPKEMERSS